MPAGLPASSGYTYAVDFSADEAIAAGATQINFSQAMPVYVENFVGFPVGYALAAHGVILVAIAAAARFITRQDEIDHWHGAQEDR